MPNMRALQIEDPKLPGWKTSRLLRAPEAFWGESGEWNENTRYDQGEDLPGPITVAAVSQSDTGARMVVFSGCLAFDNQNIYLQPGAADLWSNSVNWLSDRESLLGIGPRQAREFRLNLSGFQLSLVFFLTVIFIPLAILIWAVIVWLERRN
jgi:ABC-type uncharacterized transport system involved in gliding motility auxiliary subunit